MGTISGTNFISGYDGDKIDTLLGLIEARVTDVTGESVEGFVGACQAAQNAAEDAQAAAEQAEDAAAYWAALAHESAGTELIDTATETKYIFGVTNGRLYLVEV